MEIPSEPPEGYSGTINPDLRNYNMFREFWKRQPFVQRASELYGRLPETVRSAIEFGVSLIPSSATEAAVSPLKVANYRTVIDASGKPLTIVKEGVRRLKGNARKANDAIDIGRMSSKKWDAYKTLSQMSKEGEISGTVEQEVLDNFKNGNGAIYDAILKKK